MTDSAVEEKVDRTQLPLNLWKVQLATGGLVHVRAHDINFSPEAIFFERWVKSFPGVGSSNPFSPTGVDREIVAFFPVAQVVSATCVRED